MQPRYFDVHRTLRWCSLGIAGILWSTASLNAQQRSTTPIANWAPLMPFVATDTARNVTGYLESGPESTPATCLAAVQLARRELDRWPYRDTLPPAVRMALDTLPTAVRALGTRCWASASASAGVTQDPRSVLALALQLGDSSLAATIMAHWIASPAMQPTDRNETPLAMHNKRLVTAINMYLNDDASTLPFATTLAFVQSLVQQMDALGPSVRKSVMETRATIVLWQLDHAIQMGQWQPAQTINLVTEFLRHSDAVASQDRPGLTQRWYLLSALIRAHAFADPHGVIAFYDSLRKVSPTVEEFHMARIGDNQILLGQQLHVFLLDPLATVGDSVPPLRGTYWYHAAQAKATDNAWPHPGHVSLLVRIENDLSLDQAAMLRRLAAQYGDKGLSITIVTKTHGYWLKSGTHTGPVSPAEEAANDSAYYLGYLYLPVTLVVVPTEFTRDAEHRLRQAAPVQYESAYDQRQDALILVDRTGHLILSDVIEKEWKRSLADVTVEEEGRLSAYIARAVGQ